MANKKRTRLKDIKKITKSIETDLRWAESFYYILFNVLAPLQKPQEFRKNYPSLFLYAGWSLDIAYIVVLYKIFSADNSIGLTTLIEQIRNLHDEDKRLIDREAYDTFLSSSETHMREIKKIERKLNPLRNTFRAHNYPARKNLTLVWAQTKKWLKKGEDIFNEALELVGLPSWGYFLEDNLKDERKFLFGSIRKKKKNLKKT